MSPVQPGCRVLQPDFRAYPLPFTFWGPWQVSRLSELQTPSTRWVRNVRCLAQSRCSIEFSFPPSLPKQKSLSGEKYGMFSEYFQKKKRGKSVVSSLPLELSRVRVFLGLRCVAHWGSFLHPTSISARDRYRPGVTAGNKQTKFLFPWAGFISVNRLVGRSSLMKCFF